MARRTSLITRRAAALAFGTGVVALPSLVCAQGWSPARPPRIIVPFGPGGTSDILARALAEQLSPRLGQRVVIENRPGAGGNIGTEATADADPDGLTVLFGGMSTNAINLALYRRRDPDRAAALVPVGLLISSANVLLINPAKQDFPSLAAALSAARAAPGRFNYGSGGSGSVTHLTMELLKAAAGVDVQHIPYRGAAVPGLLSGDVAFVFDGIVSATQHVRGGTLKALGVSTATRASSLPDVPAIAEAVPGFDVPSWYAVFAPPGTPEPAIARWREALEGAAAEADFAALVARNGASLVATDAGGLTIFVARERVRWADVVARSGARVE
jgi:tripartite-type tricarboxylate transporter receptor subunit TctC